MRKPKQLQHLYRYQPLEYHRVAGEYKPLNPDEENERCYDLIHVKLAPKRLRRLSVLNIIILILLVMGLFLGSLFLPKPTESDLEKRELAKFPEFSLASLFSGEISHKIELYFSDTFPLRDWFVSLSAALTERYGVRFDNVRVIAPSNEPNNNGAQAIASEDENDQTDGFSSSQNASSESETAQSKPKPSPVDENATGIVSNGIFISEGRAMSLYGGSHESARRYSSVLNNYAKTLPDVQVYNMILPTAAEFYLPKKYASMSQSQKGVIDLVYGQLDSSIKKVDAYHAIEDHTDEYLYFRTDHHWTGRGAYYAYTAFCKQAGFTPLSIDDFESRRLENFIGTMYSESQQDSTLLNNPDYVEYFIFDQTYEAVRYDRGAPRTPIPHKLWGEYAVSPNSYSVFLQGDFPLIEVDTGIKNGRKILIVKESFGNAFAPFLINHYEKVYIVDQRYFERPLIEFIKEQGIGELLFANNTFAVCTPYQISCIENLKNATVYIPPKPDLPLEIPVEEPVQNLDDAVPEVLEQTEKKPEPKKLNENKLSERKTEGGNIKPRKLE